jgi:hypothetical protein
LFYFNLAFDNGGDINAATVCNRPSELRYHITTASGNTTYTARSTERYSVLLLNCRETKANNPIDVKVKVSMENLRPERNEISHLAIEEVMVPRILEGEILIYTFMLLGLVGQFFFFK